MKKTKLSKKAIQSAVTHYKRAVKKLPFMNEEAKQKAIARYKVAMEILAETKHHRS